ncbi:N4-gp56 family major capsid protein [Azospirillum agricola]|uniref:N4-gp56 family major capsid protein n=1 Tax=Azospirillum agricola TaxID=1720247 RepID=UPI001AE952E7|nr:N4-gp56 family major capsid protein [Azospirillum agricola]MBP2230821.1 N4-gp56 family major capsid protein [Azospirillum agricola]
MATGQTTYGDINQRTAAWAASEMLKHAEPVIVLGKFGMTKPMPKNKADTVKFRRPIPFPAATTPLVEGVTPSPQKMAYEDVPAQLKQYGKPTEITDVVDDLAEDPVLKDASMLAGEQAALTVEMVTYGVVKAGTSVFYANGSSRSAVNTPISLNKQRAITRFLKAQKAQKLTSILDGSPNYGTKPIEASYVAVAHTDLESDIRGMAGFIPVAAYGSRKPVCPEEIGSVEDVRYVLSPELSSWPNAGGAAGSMVTTSGTSADVYPVLYLGKEAFGTVPLKGAGAITPMVLNPGKPDKSDPMGQRGYVSWKTYFTAVILNQNWMARLEVSVTAL